MVKHTKRKVIGIATLIFILNLVFILIIFQLGRSSILDDTQWIIDGYEIDGEFTALIVGNRSNTFTFFDGEFIAFVGCNRIMSDYRQYDNSLNTGVITWTVIGCSRDVMQQESRFIEILQTINTFTIENNTLRIQFGEEAYIVLSSVED